MHGSFSYIWGGTSPYSIADRPNDLFCDTPRGTHQVAGALTSGMPTKAGFDCSGWVRYILCLSGDSHPYLLNASDPSCGGIYASFLSRKDLFNLYEGPREFLEYSPLDPGDIVLFGSPNRESNAYSWNHIGIVCNLSGDMLHSSRFKPGSGNLTVMKNGQEIVYPDMIGGINQMPIQAYQSPPW